MNPDDIQLDPPSDAVLDALAAYLLETEDEPIAFLIRLAQLDEPTVH